MRLSSFYIILSVLFLCACERSDSEKCYEYFDDGEVAMEVGCDAQGEYSGEMKEFYRNGNVKALRHFSDGLEQDTARYFHQSGAIEKVVPIEMGEMHGRVQWFRKDGTLEKEADYEQGVLFGEELRYHPDGKQIRQKRSYQYNILHGPFAKYTSTGSPLEDGTFYNQMRFGQWKKYRNDGSLVYAFTYSYHKKDGHFAIYRHSGIPYVTGNFLKGLLNGQISYYDKDGSIVNQENWINGENINYQPASGMPRTFAEDKAGFKLGKLQITVDGDSVAIN